MGEIEYVVDREEVVVEVMSSKLSSGRTLAEEMRNCFLLVSAVRRVDINRCQISSC